MHLVYSETGAAARVEAGAQDGEQSEGAEEEAAFQRVRQGCGEQKPGISLQYLSISGLNIVGV